MEIREVLGLSVAATKQAVFRAVQKMRRALEPLSGEDERRVEGVAMTGAHLTEEALVCHCYGDDEDAAETARHLDGCRRCQARARAAQAEPGVIEAWPVPERDAGYGERVWQRAGAGGRARAGSRGGCGGGSRAQRRWRAGRPRRGRGRTSARGRAGCWRGAAGWPWRDALGAFFLGRASRSPRGAGDAAGSPGARGGDAAAVAPGPAVAAQRRILAAALSEHLAQSERILLEIVNGPRTRPARATGEAAGDAGLLAGGHRRTSRRRASGLLDDNRLYRQTAARQGQLALASVLEDLERVLLDVARGPRELSRRAMAVLRARVDEQGLVFKVRVLEARLRELGDRPCRRPHKG